MLGDSLKSMVGLCMKRILFCFLMYIAFPHILGHLKFVIPKQNTLYISCNSRKEGCFTAILCIQASYFEKICPRVLSWLLLCLAWWQVGDWLIIFNASLLGKSGKTAAYTSFFVVSWQYETCTNDLLYPKPSHSITWGVSLFCFVYSICDVKYIWYI